MALDKVKPLKMESVDTGGNENDEFPTSLDPLEDYVECAGIVLDDATHQDESTVIDRLGDDMRFKDGSNPSGKTLTELAASGSGISEAQHEALDRLTHQINESSFDEVLFSGNRVSSIITWTNAGKTVKVREEQFSYLLGRVSQSIVIQYDGAGAEKERLTEDYTYTGNLISSVTRIKA